MPAEMNASLSDMLNYCLPIRHLFFEGFDDIKMITMRPAKTRSSSRH